MEEFRSQKKVKEKREVGKEEESPVDPPIFPPL